MPSNFDWDMLTFCQKIAHAVRKSDNLRVPQNPEAALKRMQDLIQASKRRDGVA